MKRRQFLRGAGIAAAASAVAAPAVAQSMPEVKWRCASSFPKSLDIMYGTAETFAKAVAENTDNKFQIDVFPAGEIAPALQAADAVQKGTVEMCHTASYYVDKDPTFALGTAAPFGLNARMQNAWQYFGGGIELMNDFYKGFGIYALPCGNTGCQMAGWFRKEIKDAADLKDLKIRIGGLAGLVLAKLGAAPQLLASRDIQSSLESGALDAAEWVGPYDDEKRGFQKVAPYYYYPGWWEGSFMLHNFFNLEAWNNLPKVYQSVLRTASGSANEWMLAKYDAANPPALKRLVTNGAQLRAFPQPVMEACLKAALEVYAETSAKNEAFKKVWGQMLAFRNDGYLWWQVAEASYDSFLIRNRTRT